eukprot:Sdes_comp19892_c0_seq5m12230
MISSRKFPNEWILPKGGLEMNETLEQAVLRECWEESGAVAQVVKGLGCQLVKRKNPSCFHSFLLNVTSLVENWPEQNERSRKWFTLDESINVCERKEMRNILKLCIE